MASAGCALAAIAAQALLTGTATCQERDGGADADCFLLCAPEVAFEPTVTVGNLLDAPRVVQLEGGAPRDTVRLGRDGIVEMADASLYTHKLNVGVDLAVAPFAAAQGGAWLRKVGLEVALDHLATGLPEAGDEVPAGRQLFLDDASPWSLSTLVSVPVAPVPE